MGEDHLQNLNECPDCASQNIVHGLMRDQIICRDCGLIFEPFAAAKPVARAAPGKKSKQAKPKKKSRAKKKKRR
jgi:transcription initiation factor TFIIIB Brf1 subunit/transcription initiation factor TFIIB